MLLHVLSHQEAIAMLFMLANAMLSWRVMPHGIQCRSTRMQLWKACLIGAEPQRRVV